MNGVAADVFEPGIFVLPDYSAVFAVFYCEITLLEVQRDGVRLAVVLAGIAFDGVLDYAVAVFGQHTCGQQCHQQAQKKEGEAGSPVGMLHGQFLAILECFA